MRVIVDKMRLVSSPTAIKYIEEDLTKIEQQINDLDARKGELETQGGVDMPTILKYIEYFVEHLKELLIDHCNPILRARYFGVLFDKMPNYAEIDCGTPENEKVPEVNELFKLVLSGTSSLVRERGLEPPRVQYSPAPQAGASTNSATRAFRFIIKALTLKCKLRVLLGMGW